MEEVKEKIKTLTDEVISLKEKIVKAISKDEEIKNLYVGTRIFFSNLIQKPTIYLIGINPGGGYEGDELVPLKKLEYIDNERNKYTLARETRTVFKNINRMDVLETTTFKTNIFFTSTKKQTDIYKITDLLGRNDGELGAELFNKSYKWTKELIDIIQPKIIICEGRAALVDLCNSLVLDFNEFTWENDCTKKIIKDLIIISYGRNRSSIRNKSELARLIESSLSQLNL